MPRVCPQCGSERIRKGSLHAYNGVRKLLLQTPLRCRDCQHRFWVFNPVKPVLLMIGVIALVGGTAWLALEPHSAVSTATAPATLPLARAEQGDAEAQLQLGMRYATGDSVIQNNKEAAKWFELAAKQGLVEAQYQYGLVLLQGRGVVQDYQAAFDWIEKPAKRGYAKAQYSLGELHRYGTGTAIDKARAYLWFNLAAAQGVEAAARARDGLVWQLKPEQIAAMQEEARQMSRAMHAPVPITAQADPAESDPPAATP